MVSCPCEPAQQSACTCIGGGAGGSRRGEVDSAVGLCRPQTARLLPAVPFRQSRNPRAHSIRASSWGVHTHESLEALIHYVLLVNLLEDVSPDYCVEVRLHVLEDEVDVPIVVLVTELLALEDAH